MNDVEALNEMFEKGICWECGGHLIVDFMHPDKENWVRAACPWCDYETFVARKI